MIEFFNNIWSWIVSHKDVVIAFFTSGDFAITLTGIIAIVKSAKTIKTNTLSMNSIKDTIKSNNSITDDISSIRKVALNNKDELSEIKNINLELSNKLLQIEKSVNDKLNYMFELYTVVYSTVRDETVRKAANSILLQAKYSDKITAEKIESEIEELKAKVSEKMSDVQKDVNETVNSVKNAVTGVAGVIKEEKNLKRY